MTVKTGSAWAGTFVTLDATGALATPSSGPTGKLYVDGVANSATVTITGSNPYKFSVTLPSLTAGQHVDMYITATISSIATAGIVASAQADTTLLSDGVAVASLANDSITADALKADAVTKIQTGLATSTALATVDANVDAILADTGTDGVKVAAGAIDAAAIADNAIDAGAIATGAITNAKFAAGAIDAAAIADNAIDAGAIATGAITNAKFATGAIDASAIATNAIGPAEISAAAVTKIQSGLALEATLTDIKGAGWTNETLAKIVSDISAISAGSGATAQEVWEYATRVLTAGTNIDLSSLATTTHLQEVEDKVDGIKVKTDNLPADPADDSDIDAQLAAVKTVVDAIKTETDGHPTAAEVWSYGTRTLTNSTTGAVTPAEGDTLEIIKDATVIINFTGLGDITDYDDNTSGQEDKVWFTAKKNLDDPDSSAVIQIHTLYPAGTTPPDTLDYINGAAATATEGTFQFTDLVAGNATLTLAAAAAADLPIYAVSPLYWDIKILDYSAGTVSVLASGEMYIYGTPTKSIA